MSKIPKKFKLIGTNYKVVFDKKKLEDEDCFGERPTAKINRVDILVQGGADFQPASKTKEIPFPRHCEGSRLANCGNLPCPKHVPY